MKRIHKKFTQKQLKDLIKIGSAVDITGKEKTIKESYTQIGYSMGNIGVNGYLFKSDGGQYYAICGR